MISLTYSGSTIALSDDLVWSDEFAWSGVQQTVERSVTGALLVSLGSMSGGRPITLKGSSDSGWLTRATVQALKAWEASPGIVMTLSIGATTRSVMWRLQDGPGVAAEPVLEFSAADTDNADFYVCTLNLMEV